MAGTNVLASQLQSGDFEMVTLQASIKDSGAIDVTLEEGEEGVDDSVEVQGNNRQRAKNGNEKSEQGTQTELFSIFTVADGVALIEGTHL